MLVAGHNISTSEVESALVDNHMVAEAAVVGVKDEIKGQAIAAFVILKEGHNFDAKTEEILKESRCPKDRRLGASFQDHFYRGCP